VVAHDEHDRYPEGQNQHRCVILIKNEEGLASDSSRLAVFKQRTQVHQCNVYQPALLHRGVVTLLGKFQHSFLNRFLGSFNAISPLLLSRAEPREKVLTTA
jgi:hypothetical protein